MVDKISHMYITGPDVIRTVTGEEVGHEELGGGRTHNTVSGNAHYLASDEEDALNYVRDLLSFLPQNNLDPADADVFESDLELTTEDEALDTLMPDSPSQPYDILDVVTTVLDDAEFLQVSELFAPNVVTGFGRVEGVSVGVIANQPMQLAGTLDIDASEKAARFVRLCDAFNLPILTFVDVPGFLPGTDQELGGIIRRGAKLIYAYGEATVPLITLITRKAYGGAYCVMGSKQLGADINLAWPSAQIAVMGAQGLRTSSTAASSRPPRRPVRTSTPCAANSSRTTRTLCSTRTSRQRRATSTPSSSRARPGRASCGPCGR